MKDNSEIKYGQYETWMKPQIIALFAAQYSVSEDAFTKTFDNFYEHSFQQNRCIRLVAMDDKTVVGFQTFFYWPFKFQNKELKVFQSGNSLVHPQYRGKGIFGKLLNFIDDNQRDFEYDALIGFPVEMSFGSFVRKGWNAPFVLQWYWQASSPAAALIGNNLKRLSKVLIEGNKLSVNSDPLKVKVSGSSVFRQYRSAFSEGYFYQFETGTGSDRILFDLKYQVRKKTIHELIVGGWNGENTSPENLSEALNNLKKAVKKSRAISMITIAINESTSDTLASVNSSGFRLLNKHIKFVTLTNAEVQLPDTMNWDLGRSDIDTW